MKSIEEIEKEVWKQVESSTRERDSKKIAYFNTLASDLQKVKKELERIKCAVGKAHEDLFRQGEKSVVFEIKQGAIKQNYLPIAQIRRQDLVPTDGSEFLVETSVGVSFRTKVSGSGLTLVARGKIREFFEKAGIKAGDKVMWKEIEPKSTYFLSKYEE